VPIPERGYGWFYLDGVSDDGASSIVVIAMLGNAFSPRWASARRRDPSASSLDFSTFNVSLRSGDRGCWALTERGRGAVRRGPDHLAIGASEMEWQGERLVVRVDERSAPWGSPVRGTVRLTPLATSEIAVDLDPSGLHSWSPRIPAARIEVDFQEPRVRFTGVGYLDMNRGTVPLEDTFSSWSWSRVSDGERTAIAYDVVVRDGRHCARAFGAERGDPLTAIAVAPRFALPSTRFGLARAGRSEAEPMEVLRTLEDGPFYARSLVRATLDGRRALGMHETVSLERFRAPWVRFLVPFRMRVEAA
jgi:carotenoid 1,2-hydratase